MSSNSTTKTSLTHANAPTSTALQIQTALKHNQDLQREIAAKIHKLSLLKMRNRQKASRLIYTRTNDGDSSSTNDHSFQAKPEKFYKEFAKTLRKGLERKNTDGTRRQPGMKYQTKTIISKWRYPKDGRWREVYFSDPHHDMPLPNSDVAKRKKLTASLPSAVDYKWSPAEIKKLKEVVQKVQSDGDGDIDWSAVHEKFREDNDSFEKKTRTQLHHKYLYSLSPLTNKSNFTKDESLKIMELVHLGDGQPRWDEVAAEIKNNRTPWQCFSHYQSKLNAREKTRAWNAREQELLLKHIADQGPTFCLSYPAARKIGADVLCHRGEQQTYNTAHTCVGVNPLLAEGEWTDEEEMKLCLGMKVYKDDTDDLQKYSRMPRIMAHIPKRTTRQGNEKWERYLKPDYSNEPYTKNEDEAILKVMEEAGNNFQITDLLSKFPHRSKFSLRKRWEILSTSKGLAKTSEDSFISRKAAAHKVVQKNQAGLLSPDDFVVRPKRKRKS